MALQTGRPGNRGVVVRRRRDPRPGTLGPGCRRPGPGGKRPQPDDESLLRRRRHRRRVLPTGRCYQQGRIATQRRRVVVFPHAVPHQPRRRSSRSGSESHRQYGHRRSAAPRLQRRSERRARHRWIVCAGRGGRHPRPAGPLDGPSHAIFPGQAPRRPGAVRRGSHRYAAPRANR